MALLLPRFYQARIDIGALKRLKAEAVEQPTEWYKVKAGGDPLRLRGIPVVGFGGHIPGTRPG